MTDAEVPGLSGVESGAERAAAESVEAVVRWYESRLDAERGASAPDPQRIAELKAGREAAMADRAQLATADPKEAARVTVAYAALLKELEG
ncbi:hypothetical protein ABZ135_33875 [Streptomyces sp. NPDC006339]|uniref:hypothetical protein n=1 Tax=Streptomyces sp. NPDC006339 TaxID=3156755 RepID=UPI0033B97400